MPACSPSRLAAASLAAALALGGGPARAQGERAPVPLRFQMLAAEDARGALRLAPLFAGLTSLPEIQVQAVRGLGRLERPDLVPRITPLLAASNAAVRAAAAAALGQAVSRAESSLVFDTLLARLRIEPDPVVRGELARTIGRLPYRSAGDITAAEQAIAVAMQPPVPRRPGAAGAPVAGGPAIETVLGVARALEALARRARPIQPPAAATRTALAGLVQFGRGPDGAELLAAAARDQARQVRRLAQSALVTWNATDRATLEAAASDPDAQVRRLAVAGVGPEGARPWALALLETMLLDADMRVRIEAVRQRVTTPDAVACNAARRTFADSEPSVVLTALDAAGTACAGGVDAVQALDELAVPPLADDGRFDWHRPSHALVALARLMPDRTRAKLAPFAAHRSPYVRRYAAQAAGIVGATAVLEALAADRDDNVAEAALGELVRRVGHRADPLLLAALERTDPQLLRTAARGLAGTTRRDEASRALVVALARTTVELRETSRDVRLSFLDRLEEVGAGRPAVAAELIAYLQDFDAAVAARAAAILTAWRGEPVTPRPRPLPGVRLPSLELIDRLDRSSAIVTMAGGGTIRLRLFAREAPTSVARFARLASSGFFNGLTFHRVEPTFVIQGGSPKGNEYAGDGPFTRDEVTGRSHTRGTVGISTRGRDTGDGQLFVNLVDNPRLDFNYTIVAEVVDGMDVVDHLLEGDVIRRITISRR